MANNQLVAQQKQIADSVENKVAEFVKGGQLDLPADYSPGNAMRSAWLKLQEVQTKDYKPALEVATKDSVANALLSMVVQGLNPEKNQGYFIMYGSKLTFQRSYFGTMAVTKRVTGAKDIVGQVIYEGDDVAYDMVNGKIKDLVHKQKFGNINKDKIIGAYATIVMPNPEDNYIELMTFEEILAAWSQSKMWGKDQKAPKTGSTHDKFAQEMAKKTVINRACKNFINSSDDSSVVSEFFNRQTGDIKEAEVAEEIEENANTEYFDAEYAEVDEGVGQTFDGDDRTFDERVAGGEFKKKEPVQEQKESSSSDPF